MLEPEPLERDLVAARATVAVLKEKVRAMHGGQHGAFERQLEAARAREEENRRKRDLMELRTIELARHSAQLEAEVAKRTVSMRRILNNVQFGFLVVDRDLVVQPECTDSCARLFDDDRVAGASLTSLLRLDERGAGGFRLCTDQVFEDLLPEEVSLAQIRRDFSIGNRTVRATGKVIRDAAGAVESILFTVSDVSDLMAAQRESAQNRMLLGIVRNRASFRMFLEDTRRLLAQAAEALATGDGATLRRAVHTIKGNSASYDMKDLADLVHDVEETGIDAGGLRRISAAFSRFLQDHQALLGRADDTTSGETFDVTSEQLATLRRIARAVASVELDHWIERAGERPAHALLGPVQELTKGLSRRLRKQVHLVVTGGDTLLDDATMRPVMQTVVHLIRNAIDHGIEPADERGTKPRAGQLTLRISAEPDLYRVVFSDDGAGIDRERVAAVAIKRGLATRAAVMAMSADEHAALIFLDGLSSAEQTTEVSGRGVGLSAVRAAVNAAGGAIQVCSTRAGATFTIEIPRQRTVDASRGPHCDATATLRPT